jgi:hypothetical protein
MGKTSKDKKFSRRPSRRNGPMWNLKGHKYMTKMKPVINDVDPDPYIFGPPGSRSIIICTDTDLDPSIIKQK